LNWPTLYAILEGMTDQPESRIRELRAQREDLLEQAEKLRQQILIEVRAAFPASQEPPRGTLTRMVNATGWTRAYVADIRDGKVA
jgi:hypothetical protein